jgi:hypothetical protein
MSNVRRLMKRAHLLAHLSLPVFVALLGLVLSLRREPLTGELLLSHLAWGLLFYAAPHLLWAALSAAARPVSVVRHAGFVASSSALLLVDALSFWGPRDPSGLPYQWLAYWPLAGLLLVVVVVGWLLAGRPHADA